MAASFCFAAACCKILRINIVFLPQSNLGSIHLATRGATAISTTQYNNTIQPKKQIRKKKYKTVEVMHNAKAFLSFFDSPSEILS
jgi:hypothetical protein